MQVTGVRITLAERSEAKLRGFATVTFDDCFVVRDMRIIEGVGRMFVAMPSRDVWVVCPHCRNKNGLRSTYCGRCGRRQETARVNDGGRTRLFADMAHPITKDCRDHVERKVLEAFRAEFDKSHQSGTEPDDVQGDSGDMARVRRVS